MAKRRRPAPVVETNGDALVRLMGGYYEDRALRTGAVVQVQVYPPGAVIPLAEALARDIDDYVIHEPPSLVVADAFGGPGSPVPDPWVSIDDPPFN